MLRSPSFLRPSGLALSLLALGALSVAASSCRKPQAGLHVTVSGSLVAGRDFDRLTVEVARAADSTSLDLETVEGATLPMTFNFVSGPGTPAGTEVKVTARAFWGGEQTSFVEGRATLAGGTGAALELLLPPLPSLDGGTDAGPDGGEPDGGEPDGGEPDGGSDGGKDAGWDAGADAGWDAGFDAGTDAGTDGGLPGALGSPCSAPGQCNSGFCANGVCCNGACLGSCNACNLSGSNGTCTLVPALTQGSPSCSPYLCDGTVSSCPTQCAADADCVATYYCKTTGQKPCLAKKANGQLCGSWRECLSGQCVNGYCCSTACSGACESCTLPGLVGTCSSQPSSVSPPSCSPYRCSGTSTSCGTSCTSDSNCATGNYCVAPNCVVKKTIGASCAAASECSNGMCVDGYCCDAVCSGSCNACDLAGSLGTCTSTPQSAPGNPSCAPYSCSGTTAFCATTCTGTGGCAAGTPCSSTGVCMTKLATFVDNFNDNALSGKWQLAQSGGAVVREQNADLELYSAVNDGGYAGVISQAPYDGLASSASVELSNAGNQALVSLQVVFALRRNALDRVAITVEGGNLVADTVVDGGRSKLATAAYVPSLMRFLRLRESGGTTYYEYSADGGAYLQLTSAASPFPLGEVYPELGVGTSSPEPSSTTVIFDNFNN